MSFGKFTLLPYVTHSNRVFNFAYPPNKLFSYADLQNVNKYLMLALEGDFFIRIGVW